MCMLHHVCWTYGDISYHSQLPCAESCADGEQTCVRALNENTDASCNIIQYSLLSRFLPKITEILHKTSNNGAFWKYLKIKP